MRRPQCDLLTSIATASFIEQIFSATLAPTFTCLLFESAVASRLSRLDRVPTRAQAVHHLTLEASHHSKLELLHTATSDMVDSSRQRVLNTLNSRYIYGRVVRTFLECYDFIA